MITKPFVGVLLVLCAAAASASAAESGCVTVEQGWARLPPNPAMPMTAGYGVIHNGCSKAVAITGATSSSFNDVSLHETTITDGVSRMRAIDSVWAELSLARCASDKFPLDVVGRSGSADSILHPEVEWSVQCEEATPEQLPSINLNP